MTSRSRRLWLPAVVLTTLTLLASGCASVVSGAGTTASGLGSSGASRFPSQPGAGSSTAPGQSEDSGSGSGAAGPSASPSAPASTSPSAGGSSAAAAATGCPSVSYPSAHIVYPCVTTGMSNQSGQVPIWQTYQVKVVDPKGHWALGQGAVGPLVSNGETLAQFTLDYRSEMIDQGYYLPSPKLTTVSSSDTTIGGVKAHVLQTLITLNPAQAKKNHVSVKQERLWLVALQIDATHVTMFHVSLPDLAKALWPKVPALLGAIKID